MNEATFQSHAEIWQEQELMNKSLRLFSSRVARFAENSGSKAVFAGAAHAAL